MERTILSSGTPYLLQSSWPWTYHSFFSYDLSFTKQLALEITIPVATSVVFLQAPHLLQIEAFGIEHTVLSFGTAYLLESSWHRTYHSNCCLSHLVADVTFLTNCSRRHRMYHSFFWSGVSFTKQFSWNVPHTYFETRFTALHGLRRGAKEILWNQFYQRIA